MYITETCDPANYLDRTLNEVRFGKEPCILITKAPSAFLPFIDELVERKVIFHTTITGLGGTVIEPGVNKPELELDAYKTIAEAFGPERTVLRVDPIFLMVRKNPARKVMEYYRDNSMKTRVRISFIDWYKHTRKRLAGIIEGPPTFHYPLDIRQKAYTIISEILGMNPEICGEPDMPSTGCISPRDYQALGLPVPQAGKCRQRGYCNCMSTKRQLLPKLPCNHGCLYCYWR